MALITQSVLISSSWQCSGEAWYESFLHLYHPIFIISLIVIITLGHPTRDTTPPHIGMQKLKFAYPPFYWGVLPSDLSYVGNTISPKFRIRFTAKSTDTISCIPNSPICCVFHRENRIFIVNWPGIALHSLSAYSHLVHSCLAKQHSFEGRTTNKENSTVLLDFSLAAKLTHSAWCFDCGKPAQFRMNIHACIDHSCFTRRTQPL